MKRSAITLVTGGVLAVLFGLMLFTFQVRVTEVAIVTTFGKFSQQIDKPNLYLRWPWPIQKVYKFDNRIHNFERKFEQTTTRDAINVLVTVYVGWRVADPLVHLRKNDGDQARAEQNLEPEVRNAKTSVLAQHAFSDLITTNAAASQYEKIEQEMLEAIKGPALTNYGLEIKMVGIKQLGLPESITGKVFARMKAERKTRVTQFLSEGEKEAKIKRSQADSTANKILADARASAIEITGDAEAKVSEFYKVMQQNQELAIFLMQRNALEQSLKERSTLILDQQTPPFNMLQGIPDPARTNSNK
jgi:membrane protease subunit HflC